MLRPVSGNPLWRSVWWHSGPAVHSSLPIDSRYSTSEWGRTVHVPWNWRQGRRSSRRWQTKALRTARCRCAAKLRAWRHSGRHRRDVRARDRGRAQARSVRCPSNAFCQTPRESTSPSWLAHRAGAMAITQSSRCRWVPSGGHRLVQLDVLGICQLSPYDDRSFHGLPPVPLLGCSASA